jgi:hypothetical protein
VGIRVNNFDLIVLIIANLLFGVLGIYAFYHTFKSYRYNKDFFLDLPADLGIFGVVAELILWFQRIWVPKNH